MFNITKSSPTNYPQLISIWEASVRATHHFLSEEDILYFKPKILDEYFDLVDLYMSADEEGNILGFLGLSADKIEMLFIDPQHRNKGIGRQLVRYAQNHFDIKLVDVNEQNPEAVGFYQKLGFHIIGRTPLDSEGKPFPILKMKLS